MDKKIVTVEESIQIANIVRTENKKIVLAGGCFDIIHAGHILFLEKAKSHGDILMILLESDAKITDLKGKERPINIQQDRAYILAKIIFTDYIVLLPQMVKNEDYDRVISQIKPAIIATTKGDTLRHHKERQARLTDSKVVDVIDYINKQSTTKLIKQMSKI